MKYLLILTLCVAMVSCSTSKKKRSIASMNAVSLNGTYLGVAKYKLGHDGPNDAATRIYLNASPDEQGVYYMVMLEYVNLLGMADEYIVANKAPNLSSLVGYLKDIIRRIEVYKLVPSEPGVYELENIAVGGSNLVTYKRKKPRYLVLSEKESLKHPLEGAKITSNDDLGLPEEIYFPFSNEVEKYRVKDREQVRKKNFGMQYSLAQFVYDKFKLDSTWRKEFLPGPYLAAYNKRDDVVLRLFSVNYELKKEKIDYANFVVDARKSKQSGRAKEFTNPKSAFLKGRFTVTEPIDGMFVFTPDATDSAKGTLATLNEVKGRIGLFIDIFDATKSLNQDVVELALIDPKNPEDFLMYYEDPKNGDGR